MTEEQEHSVYDVLVDHVGAAEHMQDEFVFHLTRGCEEFRFIGSLGFGGKLYVEPRRWRVVGCYPKDLTKTQAETIRGTNEALAELRVIVRAEGDSTGRYG